MRNIWLVILVGGLAACAGSGRDSTTTTAATTIDPLALQASNSSIEDGYRIGATDLLKVNVFQVPDLSIDELRVDASGLIEMSLIGRAHHCGDNDGRGARDPVGRGRARVGGLEKG